MALQSAVRESEGEEQGKVKAYSSTAWKKKKTHQNICVLGAQTQELRTVEGAGKAIVPVDAEAGRT